MSTSLITIKKSKNLYSGISKSGDEYTFTVCAHPKQSLALNLYTLSGTFLKLIDLADYNIASDLYSVVVKIKGNNAGVSYDYTCDNVTFNDPYMTDHTVIRKYKELKTVDNIERAVIKDNDYDFGNDKQLKIPYEDVIAYELHVRGFTKHPSSKVKAKGTYLGVTEKTDYLKSLSVNQVILMPSYEFYEFDTDIRVKDRLNYWGFKDGYYFCPKAGYAYSKNFTSEFKDMVKALHKAGIEVVMQFYFPKNISPLLINECICFWYTQYHIDGFYLMGENLPLNIIFANPILYDAKMYVNGVRYENGAATSENVCRYICEADRRFFYDGRKFLKGDDDAVERFLATQCYNPDDIHQLNYITCYEGFTLNDLVSYVQKHNEDNGEDNKDGFSDNISWNCGVEGKSNKKAIKDLRLTQMKNAMCLLMLSKAVPMILSGDEFMNTQNGNNNPYCQDNAVTWLNWNENKYNMQLLEFVRMLNKFRKSHPILRTNNIKSPANGFPDISYHQDNAWQYKPDSYLHHVGIMLNDDKDTLYIAYNMHWENHIFGLPKLKKGYVWKYMFDTSGHEKKEFAESLKGNQDNICLYRRTIMVLKAYKEDK